MALSMDPLARIARALERRESPEARRAELSLYVAVGDSFTAGTGCPPGCAWADRLADGLRERHPSLAFRNLAVDGATSAEVLDQFPEAIQLEPDLVSVICGANDVLRSMRPDAAAYARNLAGAFGRIKAANPSARIFTATAPDRWDFLGLGPRTRLRVERGIARFNRATRGVARTYGVPCLDVAGHPGLADPRNFAADGLHPSSLGHERAARAFAALVADGYGIEIEIE